MKKGYFLELVKILSCYPGVTQVRKLHSSYEFTLERFDKKIKLNVWEQEDGYYVGLTDHLIQNSTLAEPYRDSGSYKKPQGALEGALSGLIRHIKEPYDEVVLIKTDDF